jgi:hypothetical protein
MVLFEALRTYISRIKQTTLVATLCKEKKSTVLATELRVGKQHLTFQIWDFTFRYNEVLLDSFTETKYRLFVLYSIRNPPLQPNRC